MSVPGSHGRPGWHKPICRTVKALWNLSVACGSRVSLLPVACLSLRRLRRRTRLQACPAWAVGPQLMLCLLATEVLTWSFISLIPLHKLLFLSQVHFEKFTTPFTEITKCNIVFSLYWALKNKSLNFLFYNEIFFTLGICDMPAIKSSKHKSKMRAEGTEWEEFYHLLF